MTTIRNIKNCECVMNELTLMGVMQGHEIFAPMLDKAIIRAVGSDTRTLKNTTRALLALGFIDLSGTGYFGKKFFYLIKDPIITSKLQEEINLDVAAERNAEAMPVEIHDND